MEINWKIFTALLVINLWMAYTAQAEPISELALHYNTHHLWTIDNKGRESPMAKIFGLYDAQESGVICRGVASALNKESYGRGRYFFCLSYDDHVAKWASEFDADKLRRELARRSER